MKEEIRTDSAASAIGPYSQGIAADALLVTSGQIPVDPATGRLAGEDIETQTRQVLDNVGAVLAAGGCGWEDVIKTTIFLTDLGDFQTVNTLYGGRLAEPFPARSTVQVAALPLGARIEIEVIASRTGGGQP